MSDKHDGVNVGENGGARLSSTQRKVLEYLRGSGLFRTGITQKEAVRYTDSLFLYETIPAARRQRGCPRAPIA